MTSRVIAIDGPAGSGKSTTAHEVALRLGIWHLESGALYRALTLAALDSDMQFVGQRLVALARSLPVRLDLTGDGLRPDVAGVDVSREIRSHRVTQRVSELSAIPDVRQWVNEEVRGVVRRHLGSAVLDGRDIGTVVFPDALLKVYLTARPGVRAKRRLLQEGVEPDETRIAEAAEALARRDQADSSRAVAPLRPAEDAIELDTSDLTFEEQVDFIVRKARKVFSSLDIGSQPA